MRRRGRLQQRQQCAGADNRWRWIAFACTRTCTESCTFTESGAEPSTQPGAESCTQPSPKPGAVSGTGGDEEREARHRL